MKGRGMVDGIVICICIGVCCCARCPPPRRDMLAAPLLAVARFG
jgi:hypothetical protein